MRPFAAGWYSVICWQNKAEVNRVPRYVLIVAAIPKIGMHNLFNNFAIVSAEVSIDHRMKRLKEVRMQMNLLESSSGPIISR